jgi:hypothetical protein
LKVLASPQNLYQRPPWSTSPSATRRRHTKLLEVNRSHPNHWLDYGSVRAWSDGRPPPAQTTSCSHPVQILAIRVTFSHAYICSVKSPEHRCREDNVLQLHYIATILFNTLQAPIIPISYNGGSISSFHPHHHDLCSSQARPSPIP